MWKLDSISEPDYSEHPEDPADWEAVLMHDVHGGIYITAPGTNDDDGNTVPMQETYFTQCVEAMLAGLNSLIKT
jgi:hypothetical protein